MKKLSIVTLSLIMICGIAYYYYTTTPAYSLTKITTAIKEHDLVTFNKHVDVESIASSFFDDAISQSIANSNAEGSNDKFHAIGQAMGAGMMQMMKAPLVSQLKNAVEKFVETGSYSQESASSSKEQTTPTEKMDIENIAKNIGIDKDKKSDKPKYRIVTEGKSAIIYVSLINKELNTPIELQITMRDQGGYWQIIRLNNLAEALEIIKKEKDKILQEENSKLTEKMKGMIDYYGFSIVKEPLSAYENQATIHVFFTTKNNEKITYWDGDFIITSTDGSFKFTSPAAIDFTSSYGSALTSTSTTNANNREIPGLLGSYSIKINPFMQDHKNLWAIADTKNPKLTLLTRTIKKADGTVIRLYSSYDEIKRSP